MTKTYSVQYITLTRLTYDRGQFSWHSPVGWLTLTFPMARSDFFTVVLGLILGLFDRPHWLSPHRDIYLFIYLSNHLSIYIYIDTYILVFKLYILSKKNYSKHNVSRHMTILSSWNSLNIHLSIHLSIYHYCYLSTLLSIYLSNHLSICL